MSEPWMPVPPPEGNPYWDPAPARCPECGVIINARPTTKGWEGWCPEHETVIAVFSDSPDPENPEWKEQ
jgi:hypothetical protein